MAKQQYITLDTIKGYMCFFRVEDGLILVIELSCSKKILYVPSLASLNIELYRTIRFE